ncbi:unnamed protein product, partial [Didymodactylos carnosus]
NLRQQIPLVLRNSRLEVERHTTSIPLFNPSKYPQRLPKGLIIGTISIPSQIKENLTPSPSVLLNSLIEIPTSSNALDNIEKVLKHIDDPTQQSIFKSILVKNQKPFDTSKPTIAKSSISHAIETVAHFPPRSKSLPFFGPKLQELKDLVNPLLRSGHVIPSNSHYASPAIVTRKKDGSGRLVIDYKKLNAVTMSDNHPLPNMEETVQELGGGFKYFSKLDLRSGFWQIRIHPKKTDTKPPSPLRLGSLSGQFFLKA